MPRKGTLKTPEQKAECNRKAREKRAEYRLLNPLPPPLTPEELKARQQERQRKVNAKSKAERDRLKALGIKPVCAPLTDKQKEVMRLRARKNREAYRALNPVKKRTKEIKTPKAKPIVIKQPKKMEKILKARPERRISEKVIKPVKLDHAKQPDVIVIKSNEEGKVKVRLNSKTEVWAKPGYDINALRRKFGII